MPQRRWPVASSTLELVVGDVTQEATDAIGNAANTLLLGGGGVDGAIHRAAGPELLEACHGLKKSLQGGVLRTGGAVITPGFRLRAKHVIHCVGPMYAREEADAPELLASCYREALALVRANRLDSVAFPSIATGVYGYPVDLAAAVALDTVIAELTEHGTPSLVRFVLFDDATLEAYAKVARGRLA